MAVAPLPPETGRRRTVPRRTGTEVFGLSLPPAKLTVRSELPGLRETVAALVSPLFEVTGSPFPGAPRLALVPRDDRALPDPERLRTAPQLLLHPEGPRFAVLAHSPDRIVLVRDGEPDCEPLIITAVPGAQEVTVQVPGAGLPSARAVVRLLGALLGGRLTGRGAVFLHGSAVASGGASVMMLGPKHRGKSSLAFLAVTLCGADFVSDDTVVAWAEHSAAPPVLRGWPKRVGIGTALLAGHPARDAFLRARLRRHRPESRDASPDAVWSADPGERKRLFADLDEFTALTGAKVATGTRPAGIVVPRADRDRRGWRIERVTDVTDVAGVLGEAVLGGPDLRHFTDHLGLLPRPRFEPDVRAAVLGTLHALPCVRVEYGPDANADFTRFWGEVTAALALPGGSR
ncbi:hypothetical protein SAMN05421505_10132 [Sinosporangium album]|uniref:HprK-related kinase B n=1 Tax=Sinosporangium album TaxID=504805 RepID=A0A1G7QN23_9ACTN|nr:hypothetical protein [Sinosporangium album]SDF99279.1 hypothetical protein SAMN05421505_10132 [Sinosporangium album]